MNYPPYFLPLLTKISRDTDMPFIIHTARGCQYVSQTWRQAIEGMTRSYSHTGYLYETLALNLSIHG